MRGKIIGSLVACAGLVNAAAATAMPANNFPYPAPQAVSGDTAAHDPSMLIRASAPRYGLYATGRGIPFRTSTDRTTWTAAVPSFPPGTEPAWWNAATDGSNVIWAPDVSFRNGRYWMYYAASWWKPAEGTASNYADIGLATSTSGLPGTWQDHGKVISSVLSGPGATPWRKAIDPNLVVTPAGKWYLVFGSGGIWVVELDPATGKRPVSNPPDPRQLVNNDEAPYMYHRGSYYYLFHSAGSCCVNRPTTTYHIRVARSTSPTGPFTDRAGRSLMSDGGTRVLEGHGSLQATGHEGVMLETSDNRERLYYHYYAYDGSQPNGGSYPTRLGINILNWTGDGWPYLMHDYGGRLPNLSHPPAGYAVAPVAYPYELYEGDFLTSGNGAYTLTMQFDCNLVQRRTDTGASIWDSNTYGRGDNCRVAMQRDGDLTVYNGAGVPLCHTATSGTGDRNDLSVQNDANLVVYTYDGLPKWRRSDQCKPLP